MLLLLSFRYFLMNCQLFPERRGWLLRGEFSPFRFVDTKIRRRADTEGALQRLGEIGRELRGITGNCRELQRIAGNCRELQGVAENCRELQRIAGSCRELQRVAGNYRESPRVTENRRESQRQLQPQRFGSFPEEPFKVLRKHSPSAALARGYTGGQRGSCPWPAGVVPVRGRYGSIR